jgi:NADPH:quinone reductase-like Zn-dependent oxidoreductase
MIPPRQRKGLGGLADKLGAGSVIDSTVRDFEKQLPQVDSILDTVGGDTLDRCVSALKYGGRLVSVVSTQPLPQRKDTQAIFFYAEVTTVRLRTLTALFESCGISARVGSVLPLAEAPAGTPDARGRAAPARQDRTASFLGRIIHSD